MESKIIISVEPSQIKDYDTTNYRIKYTEEVMKGTEWEQNKVISISHTHKLKDIENRIRINKSKLLREIEELNKNYSPSVQRLEEIGDLESKWNSLFPHSPEYLNQKKKLKEVEESQALFEANKKISAQVAAYNQKLRNLTHQKWKLKNRRGAQKSKVSQKKLSQIIDSIDKEYESVYLMEDFKSYNRSWENLDNNYMSSSTNERVQTNHHSRNDQSYNIKSGSGSKFKLNKHSMKHDELQEYLKETNEIHQNESRKI